MKRVKALYEHEIKQVKVMPLNQSGCNSSSNNNIKTDDVSWEKKKY